MNIKLKQGWMLLILTILVGQSSAQSIHHWETIIRSGDNCKYYIPNSNIGQDWIKENFNDNSWIIAQSGIGYGDNDDNTTVPPGTQSVYIRYTFSIIDISHIKSLFLDVDYDDGFIAYLNGEEVARANVNDPVSWNMNLSNIHEAAMYKGGMPDRFALNHSIDELLKEGENVLAIEVHNESATSSDLSSHIFLHAGITRTGIVYGQTPTWFIDPIVVTDSDLPIMIINTNGQAIPDEPRIVSEMGLIYNGENQKNSMFDDWNEYSGQISIEQRGESSSGFAKKSYSIELQKKDSSNNNKSLLGLPKENDFVLYGPYSDKTMLKNVLTYLLYRKTKRWAPRTRYIEVILNDDYRGIYVLTEKLKRDKNRVDIDKLTPDDTTAMDISGGYILRRDKTSKLDPSDYWKSPVNQIYFEPLTYQYFDPEFEELTTKQANYIKDWMKEYDETMSSIFFAHPEVGYKNYINVGSFIDMMFINEISKGIDNYMFSTYFYKENDTDGGKLVAGPPWDYNLSYGNLDYGHNHSIPYTHSWVYDNWSRVYWYKRLMEDQWYRNQVYCRWDEYRATIYSDENVEFLIDSCVAVLGDAAVDRNFETFPILGKYVWPNAYYPDTYEEEIIDLKSWLFKRLEWIDDQWLNRGKCPIQIPIGINIDNNSIYENQPAETLIGNFHTIDPNINNTPQYLFVNGVGDEDNDKFSITGNQLWSEAIFDYEKKAQYSIRVEVIDREMNRSQRSFEIFIEDIENEAVEVNNDMIFSVSPNPTSDFFQVIDSEKNANNYEIMVLDLTGKLVLNYIGNLEEINIDLKRDSKQLIQGLYLVQINSEETIRTFKVIKQ